MASFVDARTLQLTPVDETQGRELVSAAHFILCTGASPSLPPLAGLDKVPYLTYETVFDLESLPDSLAVIGGGPIGSELAQAMARLGAKVTMVGKLMPREDEDVRSVMSRVFEEEGISVLTGRAESVEAQGSGLVLKTGDGQSASVQALLVAAGRRPKNLELLQLDRAGVKWTKGGITVDAKLRTSAKHIFAVGDCLGGLQFTHLAGYQGAVAAFNCVQAISVKAPEMAAVPRCTFTHPEVATVGLTFQEATAQHGADKISARMRMLDHVDRAVCEGETNGFIKVIVLATGEIVGATVVSPAAGEIAGELGLAVAKRLKMSALASTIHSYPAMSFAVQQIAADDYYQSLEQSRMLGCLRSCCGPRLHG
ncbi:unnamed protein product [Effrenium voratum]|nr:unnamed protein product [Effrenium voratum]